MKDLKDKIRTSDVISLEDARSKQIRFGVYSTESMSDYFSAFAVKTMDVIGNVKNIAKERAYKDATKDSIAVKTKAIDLTNVDLANISYVAPERFSGNLLALVDEMIVSYSTILPTLKRSLETLASDINLFRNTSKELKLQSPNSFTSSLLLKDQRTKLSKSINSMFTLTKSKPNTRLIESFKNNNQIVSLFHSLVTVDKTIDVSSWDEVCKIADEVNISLKSLIEELKVNDVKLTKNRPIKELSEAVYEIAKGIEYVGYIHGLLLQVYASTTSLSKSILMYKK